MLHTLPAARFATVFYRSNAAQAFAAPNPHAPKASQMKTLISSLAALALCLAAFSADAKGPKQTGPAAGKWTVGHGAGNGCWAGGAKLNGIKFCHNCLAAHGTEVHWDFPLLCNNKPTSKVSTAKLNCSGPEGSLSETKQQAALRAKVVVSTTAPCP